MFSPRAPEQSWSLTRRLAVVFALTSCTVLAIFTALIASNVIRTLRHETQNFLEHELAELGEMIALSDGSDAAVSAAVEQVARVTESPPCAFRVRRADGSIVAQAGPEYLRMLAPEPIDPDTSWRERLFSDNIALSAAPIESDDLTMEIIVDSRATVRSITEFAWTAIGLFLAAAIASALAAWFTAHRGLRGLREVVSRAQSTVSPAAIETIELDHAPEEVRAVANALNVMLESVQQEFDSMRAFTAGLAHELRSPLQNLIGETEVALLSKRQADEYRSVLHSHLEELFELSDAVDNLVTYCRTAEPTHRALEMEHFDLAAEARLRLARETRSAARLGVSIEFEAVGLTELAADRESCLRVLRNLVGNALHWSPPGGTVFVSVEGDDRDVRLTVEDSGPGVSDQLGEKIFEPFVSGRAREGRRGSYGLGLAITHTVMSDHGGSIRYEEREDGGARFVATFPRHGSPGLGVASDREVARTSA